MITSIKKIILGSLLVCSVPAVAVLAATPTFTASGTGNNDTVTVQVNGGDANAPVVMFYTGANGTVQSSTVGYTDVNGHFRSNITTSGVGITGSGPVYVMVNGQQSASLTWPYSAQASNNTSSGVMFSPGSLTLSGGQNGTVTLSGGNGSYYISSNSNGSAVTPSISGNVLSLNGIAGGNSTITVCPTSGNGSCGTFNVNVSSTYASPTLGQSTVTLNQGAQGTVALSGGNAPYTVTSNGSGVSASISGNTLYITGNTAGSNTLNVCSTNGGCSTVQVNVQSQAQAQTTPFSIYLPVTVGQSTPITLTGGNGGSFYLQTSASSPITANLSGNTLTLGGQASGTGMVTVCQVNGSCMPINIVASASLTGTGGGYFFTSDMYMGMRSDEVAQLQMFLKEKGYFSPSVTGYFGGATKAAVQRFQRDHGVSATGYVGAMTRAELNR